MAFETKILTLSNGMKKNVNYEIRSAGGVVYYPQSREGEGNMTLLFEASHDIRRVFLAVIREMEKDFIRK